MSRKHVELEIWAIADELLAAGKEPTYELVRTNRGGKGSNSTIKKYLKSWREEHANEPSHERLKNWFKQTELELMDIIRDVKLQSTWKLEKDYIEAKQRSMALEQELEETQSQLQEVTNRLHYLEGLIKPV